MLFPAGFLEQLAVPDDGIEGGAQLVAHGGEEAALGGVGGFGGLLRYEGGAQTLHHGIEGHGEAADLIGPGHWGAAGEIAGSDLAGEFGQGLERPKDGAELDSLHGGGEQHTGAGHEGGEGGDAAAGHAVVFGGDAQAHRSELLGAGQAGLGRRLDLPPDLYEGFAGRRARGFIPAAEDGSILLEIAQFYEEHAVADHGVAGDALELTAVADQHGELALAGEEPGEILGAAGDLALEVAAVGPEEERGENQNRKGGEEDVGGEDPRQQAVAEGGRNGRRAVVSGPPKRAASDGQAMPKPELAKECRQGRRHGRQECPLHRGRRRGFLRREVTGSRRAVRDHLKTSTGRESTRNSTPSRRVTRWFTAT